jgi:ribosomal protein S18 acetylase RimI-like enzyme
MDATIVPADEVPLAAMREAFNASFADYLLKFPPFDAAAWETFLQRQGVDLSRCRAALRGSVVTAFILITPRTQRRTRIAVMGAVPAERGSGVAARLLDEAIGHTRAHGERWLELEVFSTNARAVALYRARGFEPVCDLVGWRAEPVQGLARAQAVNDMTREEAAHWLEALDEERPERLPWQASGASVQAAPGEARAWQLGSAQLVFTLTTPSSASVLSLVDRDGTQASAASLLAALRQRHPSHTLTAPQWQRDDETTHAFESAGWTRQPLMQWLMRRAL